MRKNTVFILALFAFVSCAAMNYDKMAEQDLFMHAQKYFERGKYVRAQEAFEAFLQRYPFSQNVSTAEIRVADCMFYRGNYIEAQATYEEFRKRHPLHPEIPHSLLFEAKCYYEQRLAFTQDQRNLNEAQAKLYELIERYPASAPASEARDILKDVRAQLCRREIHVGKFYLRKRERYAAAIRFEQAIALYRDSACYPEALFYAAKAWTALGEKSRAKTFIDTLLSEFPNTQWANRVASLSEEGSEK